jgi:hypothetical protein
MRLNIIALNLLFICLAFNFASLQAQNISRDMLEKEGYIEFFISLQDVNTGAMVGGQTIRVENQNTKTVQTTVTDAEGKATLIEKTGCEYDVYIGKSRSAQSFGLAAMPNKRIQVSLGFDISEQNEAQPQDNEVLLKLAVLDFENKPQANFEFALKDKKTGKISNLKTDANGFAEAIQTSGATVEVSFEKAAYYTDILLPNKSHHTYAYQLLIPNEAQRAQWQLFPSPKMALFNFRFRDLNGQDIAGETFSVGGGKINEKSHFVKTDERGFAQLLLPAGGTRTVSHSRNESFRYIDTDWKSSADIQIYFIDYSSISEAQRKAYDDYLLELETFRDSSNAVAEAERRAFEADLRAQLKYADSLQQAEIIAAAAEKMEKMAAKASKATDVKTDPKTDSSTIIPSVEPKKAEVKTGSSGVRIDMHRVASPKKLEQCANEYREIMKLDPTVFERDGYTVLAVLKRMDSEWNNTIIVTDVTGSMMPYINQVLLWHALKNAENATQNYVFFNDGDERRTEDKVIGITNGIYGVRTDILQLLYNTMATTCMRGSGGDSPENDIEALLYAQKYTLADTTMALILVADGLSPVRDISLLSKLKKPVHVILCGSENADGSVNINTDYFNIAFYTGGSVHTIEKDILDISKTPEGGIIKIGPHEYVLKNSQFVPNQIGSKSFGK